MKKLLPLAIAILGLGAGVGAGLALKPAPQADAAAAPACAEDAEAPCEAAAADPFAPVEPAPDAPKAAMIYVPIEKPFVVPVFSSDKVIAMVVVGLSVEIGVEAETQVKAVEPRLRDSFLKVMFRHANSGGFDGSFTTGQKIADLKSALLDAARGVLGAAPVGEILITEIARQDV